MEKMEKLRDMVKKLASQESRKPLTANEISLIEQRLLQSFPVSHIPTHPTYASMILEAINELNEGGSTEDSISEYIKGHYNDLPWAHKSYMSHHLNKLCEKGLVVFTSNKRYLTSDSNPNITPRGRQLKRKFGSGHIIEEDLGEFRAIENYKDDEKEKSMMIEKRNTKRARPILFFDEEDELVELSIRGDEGEHGISGCEIQLGEKHGEHKRQKSEVCDRESHLEEHCIERLEEEQVLSQDQPDLVITELGDPEEAERLDNDGKTEQQLKLIKWIEDQSLTSECQDEARTGILNSENDSSVSKLLAGPKGGKSFKSKVQRKEKEIIKRKKENVLVCGLSTKLLEQDNRRRKITRLQKNLEKQLQELAVSSPDSPPSPELPEHGHEQDKSDELEMPLIKLKCKKLRSTREETKLVDTEERLWPTWVQSLLQACFFHKCEAHKDCNQSRRSLCNMYCLQCMNGAFCYLCLELHSCHPTIQIRRTTGFVDAIKVSDIKSYLDITGIETRVFMGLTTVSLSRKTFAKDRKGYTKTCLVCERPLGDSFKFCSLRCKHEFVMDASALSMNS